MADQVADRTPLKAMARWWPVVVLCVLAGGALAVAAAAARPTTYTASARLAVGGGSIAAQAVPGFALASQQLASNYARFVETPPVVAALPASERDLVQSVSASPVPDSNVILLEATATSDAAARLAAQTGATLLRDQVGAALEVVSPQEALQQFSDISAKVAKVEQQRANAQSAYAQLRSRIGTADEPTATQLGIASAAVARTTSALAVLQVQQSALSTKYQNAVNSPTSQTALEIVQPAAAEYDDRRSKVERFGVLGVGVGLLVAALIAVALERRSGRRAAARGRSRSVTPAATSTGAGVTTPAR